MYDPEIKPGTYGSIEEHKKAKSYTYMEKFLEEFYMEWNSKFDLHT